MAQVEVDFGDFETVILEAIQRRIQGAALAVAQQVPDLIRDKASGQNKDVTGADMPPKKPRPPKNPRNSPDRPLYDTGNMLDDGRWTWEATDDGAVVTYDPPDYYTYVIEKRPWILSDAINEDVRAQVNELFEQAFREYSE